MTGEYKAGQYGEERKQWSTPGAVEKKKAKKLS